MAWIMRLARAMEMKDRKLTAPSVSGEELSMNAQRERFAASIHSIELAILRTHAEWRHWFESGMARMKNRVRFHIDPPLRSCEAELNDVKRAARRNVKYPDMCE